MENSDKIKDLFNEKLANLESNVRPEIWESISSQLGSTVASTTVTTTTSIFTKTIIGLSVAASLGGLGYFIMNDDKKPEPNSTTENKVNSEITSEEKTIENQTPFIQKKRNKEQNTNLTSSKVEESVLFGEEWKMPNLTDFIDLGTPALVVTDPIVTAEKDPIITLEKDDNSEGSSVDKNQILQIVPETTLEEEAYWIKELPNTFTPNGDNINDWFLIESTGLSDFSIVVLNMQNKIVFQSDNPNFKWDGIGRDNDFVPEGDYIYYITARDTNGKLVSKSNRLVIKRGY